MRKILPAVVIALTGLVAAVPASASSDFNRSDRSCSQSAWSSRRLTVVALTADNTLLCAREDHPNRARKIGVISGLQGDSSLVGIDYRPATGELYGLGNAGGIYTIDTARATASKKATLNVALNGTNFGVDFNPTVDRLRVVSDTGQNLRVNVADGSTTVDAALNTGPGTTATGITGAAYTNNDADPNTATTLFDIDSSLDQVAIQAPPNNGSLNPTGKLGVDAQPAVGFDIYSAVYNGTTASNRALASLVVGSSAGLYRVDPFTGRATSSGTFRADHKVVDIAIPLS